MTSKYESDRKVEEKEVEFKQELQAEPMPKEVVEDEVLEAVEEAKRPVAEVTKENRVLVSSLRRNDDEHNRTCAYCLKRKPVDEFARLKKSDVCQDCE